MMKNKNRPATLHMVAEVAGVSIKTVSNVVNNWPYVSDDTRQRVNDAIRVVGYRPNHSARSLVTGKTLTVGVVIPDISNPFFGMAIRGTEDALFNGGYSLVLCNTNEDIAREKYNLDLLMGRGVDALILWGLRTCCTDLLAITGESIPVVTVDMSSDSAARNYVNINVDSVNGAYQATQHLIAHGYRRITHLQGPSLRVTAVRRAAGYCQAIEEHGIVPCPAHTVSAVPSIRGGYRAALDILREARPEAIFCYNDLMAIGVMIAARELGISVPEDLAIVGFDDISMSVLTEPPLTTVRINQYELGSMTGKVVLDQLQGHPVASQSIHFPVELQVRGSSSNAPFNLDSRKHMLENLISTLSVDLPQQESEPEAIQTMRSSDAI